MASDLNKLAEDWRTDPRLKMYAYDNVQELHKYIIKVHQSLMDTKQGTITGYLYSKQVAENKRLKERLKEIENGSK